MVSPFYHRKRLARESLVHPRLYANNTTRKTPNALDGLQVLVNIEAPSLAKFSYLQHSSWPSSAGRPGQPRPALDVRCRPINLFAEERTDMIDLSGMSALIRVGPAASVGVRPLLAEAGARIAVPTSIWRAGNDRGALRRAACTVIYRIRRSLRPPARRQQLGGVVSWSTTPGNRVLRGIEGSRSSRGSRAGRLTLRAPFISSRVLQPISGATRTRDNLSSMGRAPEPSTPAADACSKAG